MCKVRFGYVLTAALTLMWLPKLVYAHILMGDSGLTAGLAHPVGGWDHLLAMVCVGVVSAQKGRLSIGAIPVVFVVFMIIGGQLGVRGTYLPLVEFGIALSVTLMGTAVILNRNLPIAAMAVSVAIFGLYHGYAHGAEIPDPSLATFFTLGFIITTIGLHVMGVYIGLIALNSPHGPGFLNLSGTFTTAVGVGLAFQVLWP
jgi:urease accessory protein